MLESITTLAGQFKTHTELQQYCDAQYITLQKAYERIQRLEGELTHLKSVLASTPLTDNPVQIITSDEQSICEMEIQRLKETAMQRGLTLEETKRLDLLVKNLFLSKEQRKDLNVPFKNLSNISRDTLIEIASQPDPTEEV